MTRATPCLAFLWPYDQTRFNALSKLSMGRIGIGESKTLWFISFEARREVEALLCAKLEVEEDRTGQFLVVDVPSWKGKNSTEVIEALGGWVVREHQKSGPGRKPKPRDYPIPFALIEKLWNEIWTKYPAKTAVKCTTIMEDTCRLFELRRYFRKVRGCPQCSNALYVCDKHWLDGTATCDTNKLQGGKNRRKDLMPFYYHPLKVFEALGLVEHGPDSSTKLKEELLIQTVFTCNPRR